MRLGFLRQQIFADEWGPDDWDTSSPLKVWVHILDAVQWQSIAQHLEYDAVQWQSIAGYEPPQQEMTAKEYSEYKLPWFDYYRRDKKALKADAPLSKVKSVFGLAKERGDKSIPQDDSANPANVKSFQTEKDEGFDLEWSGDL